MSDIIYKKDYVPETMQIIEVYQSSGIKRPIDNVARIEKMYVNSNIIITAWENKKLVGVARALTDFSYCCYLSDLAVRQEYQSEGIGKQLIEEVKKAIGTTEEISLLLLSAPNAMEYYPKVGFEAIENGFIIKRKK
ncbi:Histone acetyltransferase HPA2-related acetyltransferase [Capnocytophaga canimorsus]|uniref:Histone acetyltransferase HPA2-related acetyltransferase n=1 Tax=Capnocytophaga canimorsus TaxID=28188 RepID=A0A0B7IKW9_9FLAO|nr:GNAT family N-acetyltransferase [Capnocytophaga canimorsus]CEN52545.1 Histone acetyltransferase HPA2-related acetyltransferase [Capnocytophaga canimorsus]